MINGLKPLDFNKEKGLTWYDLNTNTFKIWDGERWQSINRSLVSSFTQPVNVKEGDIWLDKNISELKVYDGKEYVLLNKIYEGNQVRKLNIMRYKSPNFIDPSATPRKPYLKPSIM